jgi:lipid A 4'-phosphatase
MSGKSSGVAIAGRHGRRASPWQWCLGGCLLAGVLFFAFPEIDLWVTRTAYSGSTGFIGHRYDWIKWLRNAFIVFYWACIVASVIGLTAALRGKPTLANMDPRKWLFLVLCLSIGPGLLANLVFKDQWGRARPKHVAEFGGSKRFTPAPLPADQCRRRCSFVSGEASSAFVPFYAAAAVVPQWGASLIAAGTVAGLVAGSVRIAQGAHFLSDVVFAGLLMALTVLVLRRLIHAPAGSAAQHGEWIRRRNQPAAPGAPGGLNARSGSSGQWPAEATRDRS